MSLAFVGVIIFAFGSIGGWGLIEVAFVYGIRAMGHALHGLLSGQLWATDNVVREGEFDRYPAASGQPAGPAADPAVHGHRLR